MIIGITGTNSSGKDTVAQILKGEGFIQFSLSDAIREEAKARNLPLDRDVLIRIGNELRENYGPGVLGQRILSTIKKDGVKKASVISIRNPAEAKALAIDDNFYLIWIDAPPQLRYERSIERRRDKADELFYDDFIAMENMERDAGPAGQRLDAMEEMARFRIDNNGSLDDLMEAVNRILDSLR